MPMKKVFLSLIFLYCVTLGKSANLQLDLETSYKNYLETLKANDAEKVKSVMSAHCFMKLKNIVTSSKLKYPEDFMVIANSKALSIKKERFLSAMEKANTA